MPQFAPIPSTRLQPRLPRGLGIFLGFFMAVGAIGPANAQTAAEDQPLTVTGTVTVTFDAETVDYHTVEVQQPDQQKYRSSTYIEAEEYAVAVVGHKDPVLADDLTALVPIAKAPLITVFAWLDANGNQTRPPQITWEIDPEGHYTWESGASTSEVRA